MGASPLSVLASRPRSQRGHLPDSVVGELAAYARSGRRRGPRGRGRRSRRFCAVARADSNASLGSPRCSRQVPHKVREAVGAFPLVVAVGRAACITRVRWSWRGGVCGRGRRGSRGWFVQVGRLGRDRCRGSMWSRSQERASRAHPGKTQWSSRRMTSPASMQVGRGCRRHRSGRGRGRVGW